MKHGKKGTEEKNRRVAHEAWQERHRSKKYVKVINLAFK